jgi:hypothetical protein
MAGQLKILGCSVSQHQYLGLSRKSDFDVTCLVIHLIVLYHQNILCGYHAVILLSYEDTRLIKENLNTVVLFIVLFIFSVINTLVLFPS